jgi:hypothetical protein
VLTPWALTSPSRAWRCTDAASGRHLGGGLQSRTGLDKHWYNGPESVSAALR